MQNQKALDAALLEIAQRHVPGLKAFGSSGQVLISPAALNNALREAYLNGAAGGVKFSRAARRWPAGVEQVISRKDGWVTAVIHGRWVQAKVYDEPSHYGVRECRVSKLGIAIDANAPKAGAYDDSIVYSFDRGLDFHHVDKLPADLLGKILDALNAMPKMTSAN